MHAQDLLARRFETQRGRLRSVAYRMGSSSEADDKETFVRRHRSQVATLALVDGAVGIIVAPRGRLLLALTVTVEGDRIAAYEVFADPARLRQLDLAVLP
jgi:RNA polymerase sigma-70 factor (ECF subfamily)